MIEGFQDFKNTEAGLTNQCLGIIKYTTFKRLINVESFWPMKAALEARMLKTLKILELIILILKLLTTVLRLLKGLV